MKRTRKWIRIFLPVIIILLGALGLRTMIVSRQAPQKTARENPGALVEVITAKRHDRAVKVFGTGTVQPAREVTVTPQVSGRIVWVSDAMVSGGFFKKGAPLFSIEKVDYQLAVQRSEAALAKAEVDLATVQGQALVARQEWERLDLKGDAPPPPLVLFEPQLKNARAAVASAKAALEQTRLDLSRTELRAPFNCRVRSEQVEIGQYVRAGSAVATLAGTDRSEIIVPLPYDDLRWLHIPRAGAAGEGSVATISFENDETRRTGRIDRSFGEADGKSRLARVAVVLDDPYALDAESKGITPLEVGSFVKVTITGRMLDSVIVLPRAALRTGDTVWRIGEDDLLRIVDVDVLRRERDEILLSGGIEEGSRIVLTTLSGAANGMKLRTRNDGETR